MITLQCALCGEKQKIKELYKENLYKKNINSATFSARRTPDRMHFRFVRCSNCDLIFSNPILDKKEINNLYINSVFNYSLEASYIKKTYGYYLKKLLKDEKKENLKLLDVGCGNGFFLEEAKSMGVGHVFGIEPGKASVKKAPKCLQKNIITGILEKGVFKKNSFDIVCCFQTLDHIIDPNLFLQEIYTILKKGGKALFILHDTNGLSVKLFGEKSPIFDIEHIYLFNKKNLTQILIKNNFLVLETFAVKNRYPLSYWVRMIPLSNIFKNTLLGFLKKTNIGNIPFAINAGNMGIIVEK